MQRTPTVPVDAPERTGDQTATTPSPAREPAANRSRTPDPPAQPEPEPPDQPEPEPPDQPEPEPLRWSDLYL